MKKVLSLFLAALLTASLIPWSYAADYTPATLTIITRETSAIAPGVTQDITRATLANGDPLVYYTVTAELGRDDVTVQTTYKDAAWDGDWGFSLLSDQLDAAQRVHTDKNSGRYVSEDYKVVAGMNASFYNMSTGQPSGAFAMEGHIVQDATGPFFAVLKDGTPKIGFSTADWNSLKADTENPIWEAVGGSRVQVRNGQLEATSASDFNARVSIGVTADNKVVIVASDAAQMPWSRGSDMKQMGEILLEAGCVSGIELDGGGSTTYIARQEGSDQRTLVNRPYEGAPRPISAGLLIASTTPASDRFDRAVLTPEHSYVTPNSTVGISVTGVSPAGTPAEIPEEAELKLADETMGSMSGNTFVSSGKAGDAVVQMVYNGEPAGDTTIHVVVPDTLTFSHANIAVPYGQTAEISISASYGANEVVYHDGDITLSLSAENLGTVNGLSYTACADLDGAPTSGSITATFTGGSPTATAKLTLGRGSKVLYDFESGAMPEEFYWAPISNHAQYHILTPNAGIVTEETGRVHSGQYALALQADWSNILDYNGCTCIQLCRNNEKYDLTGAVGIGAWIWIPDELAEMAIFLRTYSANGTATVSRNFQSTTSKTTGTGRWFYVYHTLDGGYIGGNADRSDVVNNRQLGFIGFECYSSTDSSIKSTAKPYTFYIDDITIDYSSVVPDREAPVFTAVNLHDNADSSTPMAKGAVTASASGSLSFSAAVTDNTAIDPVSAKAFIDGVEVEATCQNNTVRTGMLNLAAGVHTVRLEIADTTGNQASATRQINVSANTGVPTVKVVAHNPSANNLLLGSLYWVDVVATDVSAIDKVELELDLNDISGWELDHATVDSFFTMTHSVQDWRKGDNIASITLTRQPGASGEIDVRTGEVVLASLPVRVWSGDDTWTNSVDKGQWLRDVSLEVDRGLITYVTGREQETLPVFSAARIQADTQINAWKAATNKPNKELWHTHTPTAVTDGAATCTEPGFTGRTECTVCNSIVEWGTQSAEATGHVWTYAPCTSPLSPHPHTNTVPIQGTQYAMHCYYCGDLFTGEYTNPTYGTKLTYVDGFAANGWLNDSYYNSGTKILGVQPVTEDGVTKYYDFGTDGVCPGKKPYTGLVDLGSGKQGYAELGVLKTGAPTGNTDETKEVWVFVGETCYHVHENTEVYPTTFEDTRTCTTSGYFIYTCQNCSKQSKTIQWFEGHKWDENHVCTVCHKQGIDIANAILKVDKYHTYTGKGIVASITGTYNGKELSIHGDKTGKDGYNSYKDNVDIGTATFIVRGEGDFYGEKTGTFEIVPASVTTLKAVQSGEGTLTLSWDKPLGAERYALYYKAEGEEWNLTNQNQLLSDQIKSTSYTISDIKPGTYIFRAAAIADRDKAYWSTKYSEELTVTITPTFEINLNEVKNGSVSTDLTKAKAGDTVTITTAPDEGYQAKSVTVKTSSNTAVDVTKTSDNTYTFTMPASDVTVSAAFSLKSGECRYLYGAGPFLGKLELTGLIDGRTYVCQMEKANANGKSIGCAAIVVFTAENSTELLDVLPNPNGGYIVSLWAYPSSGSISDIDELENVFFGQHIKAETTQTFVDSDDTTDIPDDGENTPNDGENPDVLPMQAQCAYIVGQGAFGAQLQLTGLLSGRTYVCQMEKANTSGSSIGCAAIVVFTAADSSHTLNVLPSGAGGYLVNLWAYPASGTITEITDLINVINGQHAISK